MKIICSKHTTFGKQNRQGLADALRSCGKVERRQLYLTLIKIQDGLYPTMSFNSWKKSHTYTY